ncbi:MAG: hypothetical protein OHK0019_04310 [Saprospiraceae bacterium]
MILKYCSANNYDNVKIVTDYKSSKASILRNFEGLPDSIISCDKLLILKMIPDNRSTCYFVDQDGSQRKILLTESAKLIHNDQFIEPNAILKIPDSLFENGNFRTLYDNNKFVLFNRSLQKYLIINTNTFEGAPRVYYHDEIMTKDAFERAKNIIQSKKGVSLLDFESSKEINNKVRLPMSNVVSACLNEDTIFQFINIYFYSKDDGDNLSNRGFVFLQKRVVTFDSMSNVSFQIHIEPKMLPDSSFIGFYIFYDHQKITSNEYFSFYSVYPDNDKSKKLENQYLACIYTIDNEKIKIKKDFKFAKLNIEDTIQYDIRKFSYGNNPKYFFFKKEHFVLYKNISKVINLESGEVFTINDFIAKNMNQKVSTDYEYIFDFYASENDMKILYFSKWQPGVLKLTTITKNNSVETVNLNHKGNIDFVKVFSTEILLLNKSDDEGVVYIKRFLHPN